MELVKKGHSHVSVRINPQYRLILSYSIKADQYEAYYQFVMNEFVPGLHNLGIYMTAVWHTAYGQYPQRQVDFVTERLETLHDVFESERWQELESRLKGYTRNYARKVVRYVDHFQF
jgi:hypothetical protein